MVILFPNQERRAIPKGLGVRSSRTARLLADEFSDDEDDQSEDAEPKTSSAHKSSKKRQKIDPAQAALWV